LVRNRVAQEQHAVLTPLDELAEGKGDAGVVVDDQRIMSMPKPRLTQHRSP
jgi:hypothetical protein